MYDVDRPVPSTTPRPPRKRIDLRGSMRAPARYAIAASITAVVALAAWWWGRDEPVPAWISEWLVPALGWTWLALAAAVAIYAVVRRRDGRRS